MYCARQTARNPLPNYIRSHGNGIPVNATQISQSNCSKVDAYGIHTLIHPCLLHNITTKFANDFDSFIYRTLQRTPCRHGGSPGVSSKLDWTGLSVRESEKTPAWQHTSTGADEERMLTYATLDRLWTRSWNLDLEQGKFVVPCS